MKVTEFKKYIPLQRCVHNCLYFIMARNSDLGIFNKGNKSFILSRFKGEGKHEINYLFPEYHWDSGESTEGIKIMVNGTYKEIEMNHGTVKPVKMIEQTSFIDDKGKIKDVNKVLEYLNKIAEKIEDYL